MVEPLVSILVPSHNSARWLPATLGSALAQTHPACEIIVVDDGSTDESAAVAESFSDRGVRVVRQPQHGAAGARNAALREARGEFVQFLDADDLLAPEKIARQLTALSAAPGGMLASGPWGSFAGEAAQAEFRPEAVWADLAPVDWLATSWSGGGMFPPVVWLVPRALAESAGPWNETLSLDDDGEYFTRVLLRSRGVRFVPGARSFYRRHDGSRVSAGRGRRAAESSFASVEQKERHLLAVDDSPRTRRALALHWQRFVWEQIAAAPDLATLGLARMRHLAADLPAPDGPRAYRLAARLLGWRRARRLQLAAQRFMHR